MAKIIYEQREFKDKNTGITTQYDYIAITGTGDNKNSYEVQLKNLVQSEKMVLKILADMENGGDITTRKASAEEKEKFIDNYEKESESENFLDD